MRNKKGEIVIGFVIAMMALMMFGGMVWRHSEHGGERGSSGHCMQLQQRYDHQDETGPRGQLPAGEEGKQRD